MAELAPAPASAGSSLFPPLPSADTASPPDEERAKAELDKVGNLVTRGAYAEAGQAAERLLSEGLRDVRLVGPLFFGVFLARGFASIPALFSSIHELLTKQWGSFGPRSKRELLADNGLRWLFKALSKHLESHERFQDEVWKDWCTPQNREPVLQALALSEPLLVALASTLPKGASVPPFRQLVSWLQTFGQTLAPAPPTPKNESKPASQPVPDPVRVSAVAPEQPPAETQPPAPPMARPENRPMIPVSPALELLMRKLQGFDTLIDSGDLLKASVVASDVLATLERFDPRIYLPTLFASFFTRLSIHAQELESMMRDTESLPFRSLHQLYQVDLNAFLASEIPLSQNPRE